MSDMHGVVTSIPETNVTPDGSHAEMVLQYSNGKRQTIRFSPKTFFDLVSKTFQLVMNQQIQKAAAQGHVEVEPLNVSTTMAQEAVGGGAVIVAMKMQNGMPASFAVPISEAETLHTQLGAAIAKAKSQAGATRQ